MLTLLISGRIVSEVQLIHVRQMERHLGLLPCGVWPCRERGLFSHTRNGLENFLNQGEQHIGAPVFVRNLSTGNVKLKLMLDSCESMRGEIVKKLQGENISDREFASG